MTKQRNIYKKSAFDFLKGALLPLLFTGAVILLVMSGLRQTQESSDAEGLRILEESIRRAVVTSYAIEGRYPGSIEHIETHYGIHIDRERYGVHYNVIASNIMPEIIIYETQR